jgi:hypothetical protein
MSCATVRWAFVAAIAFVATAFCATPAFAKAPKASDTPSVEEIFQQATKAVAEAAKAAADKARDPLREAIDNYRERKLPIAEYQKLTVCINDGKTDSVQPYRGDAAQALVTRFTREDENDPQVRAVRRQIALEVLELMKAPAKDQTGLNAIETILFAWWRAKMQVEIKFKATDKLDDRKKAFEKMSKFLKKGETN